MTSRETSIKPVALFASVLLGLASWSALASASSAAELPITTAYGDELGCARVNGTGDTVFEPGGLVVRADAFTGYEWGCSYGAVWTFPHSEDTMFGVQGLCGGEGIPYLQRFIMELRPPGAPDPQELTVYTEEGDIFAELRSCAAPQRPPGRKG
ncbi:MAG: hypothetical protein KI785_10120 [Devosiaceae bacterium]|nr:hypothetical protein [Devosiaceae bacterium MH13]